MEKIKRVHIFVSGIVQGVFFRAHTRDVASSLKLTGRVKNLCDGRVEIIAEGKDENLKKLIEWCHKGPPGAVVEDVEISWEEPTGEFKNFTVTF